MRVAPRETHVLLRKRGFRWPSPGPSGDRFLAPSSRRPRRLRRTSAPPSHPRGERQWPPAARRPPPRSSFRSRCRRSEGRTRGTRRSPPTVQRPGLRTPRRSSSRSRCFVPPKDPDRRPPGSAVGRSLCALQAAKATANVGGTKAAVVFVELVGEEAAHAVEGAGRGGGGEGRHDLASPRPGRDPRGDVGRDLFLLLRRPPLRPIAVRRGRVGRRLWTATARLSRSTKFRRRLLPGPAATTRRRTTLVSSLSGTGRSTSTHATKALLKTETANSASGSPAKRETGYPTGIRTMAEAMQRARNRRRSAKPGGRALLQ